MENRRNNGGRNMECGNYQVIVKDYSSSYKILKDKVNYVQEKYSREYYKYAAANIIYLTVAYFICVIPFLERFQKAGTGTQFIVFVLIPVLTVVVSLKLCKRYYLNKMNYELYHNVVSVKQNHDMLEIIGLMQVCRQKDSKIDSISESGVIVKKDNALVRYDVKTVIEKTSTPIPGVMEVFFYDTYVKFKIPKEEIV